MKKVISLFLLCSSIMSLQAKTIYDELVEAAKAVNKMAPMQIDKHTRLEKCKAKEPNSLYYYYTLTDLDVSQLNKEVFTSTMQQQLTAQVKGNALMKYLKDKNTTFVYLYYTEDKKPYVKLVIGPKQYK